MRKESVIAVICAIFFCCVIISMHVLRTHYVVPILMYHSVSEAATPDTMLIVSPASFERQMRFLKNNHYNVLSLEQLVALIYNKRAIPAKSVVLTFDDGYKDTYLNAFPVLKKYNLPATVFVIVDEVGRPDRLSWDQITRMSYSGLITVGSHALDAEPLVNLSSPEEVKRQIFESKRILQQKVGRPILFFSYPEGLFNKTIKKLVVDAGYEAAVATHYGKQYSNDDLYLLKRLRIGPTSDNLLVFWVESSGYYDFLRGGKHKK